MNVVVPVEITRDDVEALAELLDSCPNGVITDFVVKVLKKTHEITSSMEAVASEIKNVNPLSMCDIQV